MIGLFQAMFERNVLTFNLGWDRNAQPVANFADARDLQRQLKGAGVRSRASFIPARAQPSTLSPSRAR